VDASTQAVSDVVLRDGSTMRFRPPEAADAAALLDFFRGLSDRSLYLRFHGHPSVDERLVQPVLDPDWVERGALVGTKDDLVVALASYVRLRDARTAEVAFAVADDLQGRGIATRLLERLASLAAVVGIEEFIAEVMPDNSAMLHVFADAGFEAARTMERGTTEVRLRVEATEVVRTRIDERDHVAVAASLEPFFAPNAVAVIGASPRAGSIGGELFRNVLRGEFAGVAYPVNRSGEPVAGVRAYQTVAAMPPPPSPPGAYVSNRRGHAIPGSLGWVVPGFEARVADADGRPVTPGKEDELLVRGGQRGGRDRLDRVRPGAGRRVGRGGLRGRGGGGRRVLQVARAGGCLQGDTGELRIAGPHGDRACGAPAGGPDRRSDRERRDPCDAHGPGGGAGRGGRSGRLPGLPGGRFITGQALSVNGGLVM